MPLFGHFMIFGNGWQPRWLTKWHLIKDGQCLTKGFRHQNVISKMCPHLWYFPSESELRNLSNLCRNLIFIYLLRILLSQFLLVARRATYVVDGRFFGLFFWKVEGTVRTHVNSRLAHVWLPYTVINVWGVWGVGGAGIANIGKLGKLQIFIKVMGSISRHIGSHEW